MDRKTLLGLGLILVIIFVWPFYIRLVSPDLPPAPAQKKTPIDTIPEARSDSSRKPITPVTDKTPIRAALADSIVETTFAVETTLYSAVISNKAGGTIKQWVLKKYKDGMGEPVDFVNGKNNFERQFYYQGSPINFSSLRFNQVGNQRSVSLTDSNTHTIRYVAALSDGSQIQIEHTFRDGVYDFETRIDWSGLRGSLGEEYRLSWQSGLVPTEKNIDGDYSYFKAYAMLGDDKEEFHNTDPTSEVSFTGVTKWMATRTKYFVLYLIPKNKMGAGCKFEGVHNTSDGHVVEQTNKLHLSMKMDRGTTDVFQTYIGPMDYQILGKYEGNLPIIMEWGWAVFRPLTKAILYTFQFLFGLIPNYGWVIIVFALIVKLILYPLTHKSYVGMQKMREVMPRQKELQKKFKDNPAKMQQELMKLYKEVGYNPLSGCLPLLIQMPILFPIYQVFGESIDLRQAHFMGWINDLSVPDTVAILHTGLPFIGDFHVNPLPIIMTALTFVQQKFAPMTPTDDSDPAQRFNQKFLQYGMPVMFFFIFNNFSSGLVLYWTIFNVLTMLQQLLMSKHVIK